MHNRNPLSPRKLAKGFAVLLIILLSGTLGYMVVEGWGFLDSLYMTVITITTVGFREVGPISAEGEVFTI
ncbi:MAG: two pore domain potassium channel family protein, partial [Deltaproteobacteria bacterium]|nr:two pore domain potassium channel family protein [Deltaproteobacteria bacterium]